MKSRYKNRLVAILIITCVFIYIAYGAILGIYPLVDRSHDAGFMPYQGAGGYLALQDVLLRSGVELSRINAYSLADLRTALDKNPTSSAEPFILYKR